MSALIELSNDSHMTTHECHESHASVERPSDHSLMKTMKQGHKQQKNLLHKLQEQYESTSKSIVSSISSVTTEQRQVIQQISQEQKQLSQEQKQLIHQISQEQKELVTLLERPLSQVDHQLLCNDILEGIQLFTKTNSQLLKQEQRQHIEENINKLNDTIQKSHLDMISEILKQLKLNQQDINYTKTSINALPNTISSMMSNLPKSIVFQVQDTLQKAMQKNDSIEELKLLKTVLFGVKQDIMSLITLQKQDTTSLITNQLQQIEKLEQMDKMDNMHLLLKKESIDSVHELKQCLENLHQLSRNETSREVHDMERFMEDKIDTIQQTIEELRITNHRLDNDNIDRISHLLDDNQKIQEQLLSGLQTTIEEQTLSLHRLLEQFIESMALHTTNNNQQLTSFMELTRQQHCDLVDSTAKGLQHINNTFLQHNRMVEVPMQHNHVCSVGRLILMIVFVFTFFTWMFIGVSANPDPSIFYG